MNALYSLIHIYIYIYIYILNTQMHIVTFTLVNYRIK
jgi:hypothetical protein